DGVDISVIEVPLGSLFSMELLWAKGPTIKARSMTVGTVSAEFESNFSQAGINQTLHRIYLHVTVPITLLLAGDTVETEITTKLCVSETVIVGTVPNTNLQLPTLTY
ncbi:MAG: sporulation protein YunB, partial [Eubacteriales bacterium]